MSLAAGTKLGPYEIVSLGSSGKEGGTGTAVAIKSWERR